MEHRFLLGGGEQWLPFARSCVAKLKKLGLPYANQSYEVDGASIKVRIEPGHEYIRIEGGRLLLSGFVGDGAIMGDVYDDDGKFVKTINWSETAQGQITWYMEKFWPRSDLRPKGTTGWLTRGSQPKKLANLELTFNGTSFRETGIPTPDARALEYGKRAPASMYTGTMRKVVQVLLGACKGSPRAQRTDTADKLDLPGGFNNADIPYGYTYACSHGIFTCSDHTKEKPNVWVIEISQYRGVLAWKLDTTVVNAKTNNPDVYQALGYMPRATKRPVSADEDQKGLVQLMPADHAQLMGYWGHEPLYPECGWAFSYSGRAAANIVVEKRYTESGMHVLTTWSQLWKAVISEGSAEVDGVVVKRPANISFTHTESRMGFDGANAVNVPNVSAGGTRSLIRYELELQIGDPFPDEDGKGSFTFPIYAFYGHDSDELKTINYVHNSFHDMETTYGDYPYWTMSYATRDRIRTLKNGTESQGSAGGFSGYGMPGAYENYGYTGIINDVTLGEVIGWSDIHQYAGMLGQMYRVNNSVRTENESRMRGQSLFVPFGDREAVYIYSFTSINKAVGEVENGNSLPGGMPCGPGFNHGIVDVWNADGSYYGSRWNFGPSGANYDSPGDGPSMSAWGVIPTLGDFVVPAGALLPGQHSPVAEAPTYTPPVTTASRTPSMSLVTSAKVVAMGNLTAIAPDFTGPAEMGYYRGDSMTDHLIDVTSEAFTGAYSAMEGVNKFGKFVTNAGYYTAGPAARFGYWVGVPFYTKA